MKLQRDQVVAATLVGTVVVVLGFASGIGRVPQAQNSISQPEQHSHTPTPSPVEQPHQPANHVAQPVAHNPAPVAHQPEGPHVPAPEHPHHTMPPTTTKPPATTPTTPPTTEPGKPCDVGAITTLLRELRLLPQLDELPVVHELPTGTRKAAGQPSFVELPLLGDPTKLLGDTTKLLDDLLGTTCSLVVDEKTNQVTALLDTP
ncbi:hypothetical protein UK23_36460 [Lentzea aerocolonigenes]|uniref:Uncharacterized protein n=1 Tax=Lentzea aerocolonigenes TaxID=68170 RepID=A0A0F0GGW1_LENAE|nr:hypothetical protein [Lentzea aerocolonigenes]KJK42595.1 hypothetical protein UK23_36460 [Lentzea aerocolonigenes]